MIDIEKIKKIIKDEDLKGHPGYDEFLDSVARQIAALCNKEKEEAVKQAKKMMLGKLITQSVIRNLVDVVDKKQKPFRKVDEPIEWWDSLLE